MPRSRTVPVQVYDDIEALAPEWDELADRAAAPPFLRPGWVGAWWRAFGTGEPEILAVRDGGRLRGVLPLCRHRGVVRSMANDHAVESGFLAADTPAATELARGLVERLEHRGSLLFVDPTRPGLAELRSVAAATGTHLHARTMVRSPYLPIDGDWPAYVHRLSRQLRADLRRRRRRLEEQGRVSVEFRDGREDRDALLTEAFTVEASGWKGASGTAISSQPETERFYRDVATWAAERGTLHLALLRLDGRVLAFEFGLRDRDVHCTPKVGFDPAFARVAPGKLLLLAVLEDVFSSGVARFDFLGTDDPYKLEWVSGLRDLVLVQLFAPDLRGSVARVVTRGVPAIRRARALVGRG